MNPITWLSKLFSSDENVMTSQAGVDSFAVSRFRFAKRCKPSHISRIVRERQEKMRAEKRAVRLRAAYALNLCMTSLSQIIDYNDTLVLRQEYNAVLNNLNMERMPRNEALLDALKRILDACHYYIQYARDKEMLAKVREGRLRRALTDSMTGGNIFVAGGNPLAVASMVVAAIGITAVKYKSQKEKIREEFEVKEYEMEKSALDQLHNLRRTLFETAWRMTDKYDLHDELRLSESQITSYNQAVADDDPLSRFERLELLRGSAIDWTGVDVKTIVACENGEAGIFAAYPMYWYYLARAALEVAEIYRPRDKYPSKEMKPVLSNASRDPDNNKYERYRTIARKALAVFTLKYDDFRLLREDEVAAGAYLDYASFADEKGCVGEGMHALQCIERAQSLAGVNMEIIQSCAINYLNLYYKKELGAEEKRQARDHAIFCLRMLVNEGYNFDLNAKALSRFYRELGPQWEAQYQLMFDCVANKHPFPYRWLEPFSDAELDGFWPRFKSIGLKRLFANFFDGRLRLVFAEFFQACAVARGEGSWETIYKALVARGWNGAVEWKEKEGRIDYEMSEKDPKQLLNNDLLFKGGDDMMSVVTTIKRDAVKSLLLESADASMAAVPVKLLLGIVRTKRALQYLDKMADKITKRQALEWAACTEFANRFKTELSHRLQSSADVGSALAAFNKEIVSFIGESKTTKFIFFSACSKEFDAEEVKGLFEKIEGALNSFVKAQVNIACEVFWAMIEEDKPSCESGAIIFAGELEERSEEMRNSIREMGFLGSDFKYPKYDFETVGVDKS